MKEIYLVSLLPQPHITKLEITWEDEFYVRIHIGPGISNKISRKTRFYWVEETEIEAKNSLVGYLTEKLTVARNTVADYEKLIREFK